MAEKNLNDIEARLDRYAGDIVVNRHNDIGYPVNQKSKLLDFYKWFIGSGLNLTMANNAGDPFDVNNRHVNTNSHAFEREVIEKIHLAPPFI